VGLVALRIASTENQRHTLGAFIAGYIDGRTHYKSNTRKTIDQAKRLLVEQFGDDKQLDAITGADAEDWQIALRSAGCKPATIATHVKRARQMFAYAVRAE